MLREGMKVAYTGPESDTQRLGDEGRVLSLSGPVAHVTWTTGALAGQVTPQYAEFDLAPLKAHQAAQSAPRDDLADSLEVGGLVTFAVRSTFETGGATAILNEMAESGHLASFADYAEEALAVVASRIRGDVSFRVVLAELDEEEAESVLRLASACLIRDAFGAEE